MSNKVTIHEFDPVIYPYKFWVAISDNVEKLQEHFIHKNGKELEGDISFNMGVTCDVTSKIRPKHKGVLIIFTKKKYITPDIIAHEAYHASQSIFEYIQETYPSEEATAYLIGWIAGCCEKVKHNASR